MWHMVDIVYIYILICYMVQGIWYSISKDPINHGVWNPPCLGPYNQNVGSAAAET